MKSLFYKFISQCSEILSLIGVVIVKKFYRFELWLSDRLSVLFFGELEVEEFDDIKLPSEDRPEPEEVKKAKKRFTRRPKLQLSLFFKRAIKRRLYVLVMGIESVVMRIKSDKVLR